MTPGRSFIALGIALGVTACQGADPGVSESFALATATSWGDGKLIETELRDAHGVVVATAEWDVADRQGTLVASGKSTTIQLSAGLDLTEATANSVTYELWVASSPELVGYDNFPGSCSSWEYYNGCWYRTCSACVTTTWGEQCAAIGQSTCDCCGGY